MKSLHYKTNLIITLLLCFFILTLLLFEERNESFYIYYIIIYNRVYFVFVYYVLFIVGLNKIICDIDKAEIVIRYNKLLQYYYVVYRRNLYFSLYFSLLFVLVNIIVINFYSIDMHYSIFDLSLQFFVQWAGWLFISLFITTIYLLLKNQIASYMISLLILCLSTPISYLYINPEYRFTISLHELMFNIVSVDSDKQIHYLLYILSLLLGLSVALYFVIKKRDYSNKNIGNEK
jgi:hypothetical protein